MECMDVVGNQNMFTTVGYVGKQAMLVILLYYQLMNLQYIFIQNNQTALE